MGHFVLDKETGNWYSLFYDRRHANGNKALDLTLAWSSGDTIFNQRLTPISFASPGKTKFFGDYIGVDAHNDFIVPLWTEYHGDLKLFTLPLNRNKLKATSHNFLPIYSEIHNNELLIHYKNGLEGNIHLYKKCLIFKSNRIIKLNEPPQKNGTYTHKIKSTKNLIIKIEAHVPNTHYKESTQYSFQ